MAALREGEHPIAAELTIALKLFEIATIAAPKLLDLIREGREAEVATLLAACQPPPRAILEADVEQQEGKGPS